MDDDEPEEWKQLCSALYDGDASWVHSLLTDCPSLVHYRNTVVSKCQIFHFCISGIKMLELTAGGVSPFV
jgi:hypothetical protein